MADVGGVRIEFNVRPLRVLFEIGRRHGLTTGVRPRLRSVSLDDADCRMGSLVAFGPRSPAGAALSAARFKLAWSAFSFGRPPTRVPRRAMRSKEAVPTARTQASSDGGAVQHAPLQRRTWAAAALRERMLGRGTVSVAPTCQRCRRHLMISAAAP